MIGRSGERGSGISELVARHDDDDNDTYTNLCFSKKKKLIENIKYSFIFKFDQSAGAVKYTD